MGPSILVDGQDQEIRTTQLRAALRFNEAAGSSEDRIGNVIDLLDAFESSM